MNSRAKFAKKHKKQNIWKPTSNVFTEVGFKWKPTGRTFTIVGNSCPLTRITSANVVPPKITTSHSVETQKPNLKVYSRKPKSVKNVGSSKKVKIVESKNAKHSEPNHTWRSNTTDIPSSSSLVMTSCQDCFLVSGLWMFKTHDREPLFTHELFFFRKRLRLRAGYGTVDDLISTSELIKRIIFWRRCRRGVVYDCLVFVPSRADPTLLNDFEMTAEGDSDPPVPNHQTIEELCQPSLNGRGASHGQNPPPAYKALGYQDLVRQLQIPQPQVVTTNEFTNYMKANDSILKNMQTNMTSLTNSNLELINMFGQFIKMNTASSSGSRTLSSNTITNLKEDLKGITTRSGTAYQGPTIPTTSSLPQVVERETEVKKDTVHPTNDRSTKDVQLLVVQAKTPTLNSEPIVAPIIEPVVSPVIASKPNLKPSIPYPSRLNDQKLHDKANDQKEKFFQIFKDLDFNISFVDALILMPKFGPTIKTLLTNKDKLSELARTLLNEHWSVVLRKKLPKKLGDPGKFLISCDFLGMDKCLALADLGASINLMPLSVWNKLSLPELSLTCMPLELADRSISHPVGVAKDVFVKVGTFHFLADFIVVDFDADPRVPLILGRSFLKIERALIDVFEGELTLHFGKEAITFNLDQTSRYSANYNDMTANRIDVIYMACEEYSQEVLSFSDVIASGNPTPYYDLIVSTSSPTLTPFGDTKYDKSSIDEPPEVELKDLPPHLEYAFLEGDDKFPVIISKDLSDEEKTALITVLKSHKQAIAWKLSDIKGINPKFCTYKILMEEHFKPAVHYQRRVNPKIHDVIKKEVEKLLDVELIYLISDSPWVSLVHCVPKKGGFSIVENEENELILTRLVTGWRVCIDYRKLNEAIRKDHFPLPFMDQMLESLAGNKYYCFLDGFLSYFLIPIDPKDQEKTTFTCPYGTFSYRRMPFGLCNAPGTFQRCMMAIFYCMIEKTMEEKSYFMVKKSIVLGHKISKDGIEVDKAKVKVITKLPHPTTIKGIRSFLGHAGFYRRFIKDFSKIARPMTSLFEKDTPFLFSKECVKSFQTLKRKLTKAPILITLDWVLPFELMCDASDFVIGVVLRQRQEKHFRPIHYASKTMTEAESNYTRTEKEMLAVVYAFEKFRSYLILNKSIVYTDHFSLKYIFAKKDSKARLLRWVLLLQEFKFKLVLLVYKVTTVFMEVNAAKSRVTTAVRVSTARWIKWLEDQDMRANELKIYSLGSISCIRAYGEALNKEARTTATTLTAKLPILNLGEYEIWKNEMKARGTLLMTLPNKDQLKFHSYQDAKLLRRGEVIEQEDINLNLLRSLPSKWKTHALIWRNKAEIETISLDDLYNNLKIYEPELTGSLSTSQNLQNVAFVSSNSTNSTSSTNEADNIAYGVSTAHTQGNTVNSTSIENLSDAMICDFLASHPNSPQLAREDSKHIDPDNLEEMDLHWEMVMLTIRARRFTKRTCKNLDINGKKLGLQLVEERLVHYKKNEAIFRDKINILNLEVKLRDNALVQYTKNLEKVEKERDELKLTLEKYQNSFKSLNTLLESQVSNKDKTGLGYKAASPTIGNFVNSSRMIENQKNVRSISDKGYHAVPSPYTGNYVLPKPDRLFIDKQVESKSVDVVSTVSSSAIKTVELKIKSVDVKNKGVYRTVETKPVKKNNFSPPIVED
nr:reverse transcriptase domain-containing protein [Tanacetum cinerariifolium]